MLLQAEITTFHFDFSTQFPIVKACAKERGELVEQANLSSAQKHCNPYRQAQTSSLLCSFVRELGDFGPAEVARAEGPQCQH